MIWKHKNISIWSKEKNKKNLNFFKNAFEMQKQTGFYKIQLEACKNYFIKIAL